MRARLLDCVEATLSEHGFYHFQCSAVRGCFDIVARRENATLLLKVLYNIDGFTNRQAKDMCAIASLISAYGMLIGERSKEFMLKDGVLYERYGVPTANLNTFVDILSENLPRVMKFKKSLVCINGEKISAWRKRNKISLSELSDLTGISKDTIFRYEHSLTYATLENVNKIEKIIQENIRKPVGLCVPEKEFSTNSERLLASLGFQTISTNSAPFDAFAKKGEIVAIGKDADMRTQMKRVGIYTGISRVLNLLSCFMLKSDKRKEIGGVAVVSRSELREIGSAKEFLKLVKERSRMGNA
ncbi:MAG: helix-turn-helix domain-containing protein [Candidatus Micrarchaeia archaeon]